MAKRTAQTHKKVFNLDFDSLLKCDMSQEEQNELQTSSTESCNEPKKLKSKDSKHKKVSNSNSDNNLRRNIEEVNETDGVTDVTKFFENVGNDFSKSVQVRKLRLGKFTESVISLYQSKITNMIKKQETEIEEFKEQAAGNIQGELNKFEEEFKKLKQQENKLMKVLEQQLKMLQKTTVVQEQWMENFHKLHQNFLQEYEKLRDKHKDEAMDLKKTVISEVSSLQSKFLMESKKEEMQTMKKYLSDVYF